MTERTSDADQARMVTRGMPSNGDGASPVSLDLVLPGTVEAPSVARNALRRWMDGLDCPDESVEDAVLVVSEVVTNAVVHASSAPARSSRSSEIGCASRSMTCRAAPRDASPKRCHWRPGPVHCRPVG